MGVAVILRESQLWGILGEKEERESIEERKEDRVCGGGGVVVEGSEQKAASLSFLSLKIPFSPEPALPQGYTLNVPLFCFGSRRFGS